MSLQTPAQLPNPPDLGSQIRKSWMINPILCVCTRFLPAGDSTTGDLLGRQPAPRRRLLWQRPGGFRNSQQQEFIRAAAWSPATSRGGLWAHNTGGQRWGGGARGKWSVWEREVAKVFIYCKLVKVLIWLFCLRKSKKVQVLKCS